MRTVTRQRATQAGVHRQAGDAWTVFKQTTGMFCEDFLWPCSQELSFPFLPFLFPPLGPPLPSLSPSLLSPCLPSPGATLPFILTPTQLPTITYHHVHAHLTSTCVCYTQRHAHVPYFLAGLLRPESPVSSSLSGRPASSSLQNISPVRVGFAGHPAFDFPGDSSHTLQRLRT